MFVYAVGCELGLVKIGKAANPEKRLVELQVGSPVELFIWATVNCGSDADAEALERVIHDKIDGFHVRGEWFRVVSSALRPFFPDISDEMPLTSATRMESIVKFYETSIPTYSEETRRSLQLLHGASNDDELIRTLINKCATGRLAA